MIRIALSASIALGALALGAAPAAAVPAQISFAGRLADSGGPVAGSVDLEFRLFDGPTRVWEEAHDNIAATNGLVFVSLGSADALDTDVFTGDALELEIVVNGDVMSPRLPIRSVPYAQRAALSEDALRLEGQPASAFAPASHTHAGTYLPLGSTLSCPANQKATAISAAGDLVCAADENTVYTALVNGGLALAGNQFSIATGGVTSTHLAADAVTGTKIATNAVGSDAILAGAVGTDEIANNTVGVDDLAPNAVGNSELATDAVTNAKLANNAVSTDELATGAVTPTDLATDAVRRAAIDGTEVTLYLRPSGCANAGTVATVNVGCLTVACGGGQFETCSGSCSSTSPIVCDLSLLGYLISPTAD
jgi:hypothetical protein